MSEWRILSGDVRASLATVESGSVQTCVTSPPYWGLRDYGTASWDGGDPTCDHRKPNADTGHIANSTLGGGKATNAAQIGGFKHECGKCGATRIDSQIGLEATPEAYVAQLVAVFREVRRVLRDDGTLWCNLGDSYASQKEGNTNGLGLSSSLGAAKGEGSRRAAERLGGKVSAANAARKSIIPVGLKPKDLVGIPWRVAFALQQPYYAGSIKSREDRIWLAAMLDAEGCMFIQKRKAGQNNGQGYQRQSDNYGPGVEISNTSLAVVERIAALVGKGSICSQGPDENGRRKQTLYRWNLRTIESRDFVREIYQHLVAKQQQARILCGCPASGERAEAAHAALISLHRTGESGVDFPAPASMFEQGYYLRSDVIWSKCNPMPESVTDRPTKAHEYIFLLSKNARYYYDAGAIAEADAGLQGGRQRAAAIRDFKYDHNEYKTRDVGNGHSGLQSTEYTGTRNKRSVWHVATQPYAEAHFATFPEDLILPCILAGSSPGDLVLDPFAGSGTTGAVSVRQNRDFIGCELNPAYVELARKRIGAVAPLFATERTA